MHTSTNDRTTRNRMTFRVIRHAVKMQLCKNTLFGLFNELQYYIKYVTV